MHQKAPFLVPFDQTSRAIPTLRAQLLDSCHSPPDAARERETIRRRRSGG
jgi:hypothetical protein